MSIDNENTEFLVVKNHQQQFSIWPSYREIPQGWSAENIKGSKTECLNYINEKWTDMRPKSLQDALTN